MNEIWPLLLSAACVGLGVAGLLFGRARQAARLSTSSLALLLCGALLLLLPGLFDALGMEQLAAYRTLITFTLPALLGVPLLGWVTFLLQSPEWDTK